MNPEQWEIHQEQQAYAFSVLLATLGTQKVLRDRAVDLFNAIDTWSKQ